MTEVMTPDHPRWEEFFDQLYERNPTFRCSGDRTHAAYVLSRLGFDAEDDGPHTLT